MTGGVFKEKVTLGNGRVSQEMAGWNAFSLWPTFKIVFGFQLSHICFQGQVLCFRRKLCTIQRDYIKTIASLLN